MVESTVQGRWSYEKSGFVVKEHYSVEAAGKAVVERLFFMVGPRASDNPLS